MYFSRFELLKYFLLQNRHAWPGLSKKQKDIIFNSNIVHNNIRDDYKNPELYQNGLNYESNIDRETLYRGKVVKKVLSQYNFNSILEIGPGSGFITKTILESHPSRYTAADIVKPFLNYCEKSIAKDKTITSECNFLFGDICTMDITETYDVIFFLSSLHHIPNREDFLNSLIKLCDTETVIILVEPTHYIQRILRIITNLPKFLSNDFVKFNNYENLSTHSFLTLREFQSFNKFQVIDYGFSYSKKLPFKFSKYFSNEMFVALKVI